VPGYNYSDANKNSGIVWDEATFKEYIKDPKAKIFRALKWVFPGIKDEKEAEDLWSFLEQFRTGRQEDENEQFSFRCSKNPFWSRTRFGR